MSEPNDTVPLITEGVDDTSTSKSHEHTIDDLAEAFRPLPPGSISLVAEAPPPLPTVGRILHAHSSLWHGPRTAFVVSDLGRADMANVNVLFDGQLDTEALEEVRRSLSGSTFAGVRVFAALSEKDRALALADAANEHRRFGGREITLICEWPPR